jgi:RNA polymerase sigma factor (sigma-70 family)
MKQTTDQDHLAIAFAHGDANAFDQIYNRFYRVVYYYTRKLIEGPDAEDITAETFFKLYKLRANFSSIRAIQQFLFITARNNAFDALARKKLIIDKHKEFEERLRFEEHRFYLAEIESDLTVKLLEAVNQLPDTKKEILSLYFKGYNASEIAAQLQLSEKTIRNQKSEALKSLRSLLIKKGMQVTLWSLLIHHNQIV